MRMLAAILLAGCAAGCAATTPRPMPIDCPACPICQDCLVERNVFWFTHCMTATYGPRLPILESDTMTGDADWWLAWQTNGSIHVCRAFDLDGDGDVDLRDWAAESNRRSKGR